MFEETNNSISEAGEPCQYPATGSSSALVSVTQAETPGVLTIVIHANAHSPRVVVEVTSDEARELIMGLAATL